MRVGKTGETKSFKQSSEAAAGRAGEKRGRAGRTHRSGQLTRTGGAAGWKAQAETQSQMPEYDHMAVSAETLLLPAGCYLLLDAAVSYLFFRTWFVFLLFLPGFFIFRKEWEKEWLKKEKQMMNSQFLTAIQSVTTALQAGYAVENAFRESLTEMEKIYDEHSFIVKELRYLVSQLALNRTAEALLGELGRRSHTEDIRNYAEVFETAKRTGGDLISISENTVSCIRQKTETRMEMEAELAGKMMEQKMMSLIPMAILGYVEITSPGFLSPLYHNLPGILVMTVCLIVYGTAFLWGKKIMDLDI